MKSPCNNSQNVGDKLYISCETAHYGKNLVFIFQGILASTHKIFISGVGLIGSGM